jgi:hypothetical protein
LGETEDLRPVAGEEALSRVLGVNFECAPLVDPKRPKDLAEQIRALIDQLVVDLIGPAPDGGDSAAATYKANANMIISTALDWLQKEVRKRLA